jgi:hypothetical protein
VARPNAGIDLDGAAGTRKLYASLVQAVGPKSSLALLPDSSFEKAKILITAAEPAQQLTPKQAILAKKYEGSQCRSRPILGVYQA